MRLTSDLLCLTGLSLVGLALWLVYPPLSIGAAGAGLLGCGVVLHRRGMVERKEADRAK